MPAPSEVEATLDAAVRHLTVAAPARLRSAHTRAHLPDGRCVGWTGPVPSGRLLVLDAEPAAAAVPARLADRFGTEGFWARWTRTECLSKLYDVPVLVWLARHGLAGAWPDSVTGGTVVLRDPTGPIVVSVAAYSATSTPTPRTIQPKSPSPGEAVSSPASAARASCAR